MVYFYLFYQIGDLVLFQSGAWQGFVSVELMCLNVNQVRTGLFLHSSKFFSWAPLGLVHYTGSSTKAQPRTYLSCLLSPSYMQVGTKFLQLTDRRKEDELTLNSL